MDAVDRRAGRGRIGAAGGGRVRAAGATAGGRFGACARGGGAVLLLLGVGLLEVGLRFFAQLGWVGAAEGQIGQV